MYIILNHSILSKSQAAVACAHAALGFHLVASDNSGNQAQYEDWLEKSFAKVILKMDFDAFLVLSRRQDVSPFVESTLNGSCVSVVIMSYEIPEDLIDIVNNLKLY